MDDLSTVQWAVLIVGSFIMGLSKGGIPGAGNLTVALFVLVLEDAMGPTGVALSVGLLLPVLISADLCFNNRLSKACSMELYPSVATLLFCRSNRRVVGI